MNKSRSIQLILLYSLILQGCSLAPRYQRPSMDIPYAYKEAGNWVKAKPQIADNAPWWEIYHDPILNKLEEDVSLCNQNLKAALWRYENAKAAVTVAAAGYYPTITGVADANRQLTSNTVANVQRNRRYNDRLLGGQLNYELDLWGRVRNTVTVAKNLAKASEADLAGVDLSLHATLASNYFSWLGADTKVQALDKLVIAYEKALALTRRRYEGGVVASVDVDEAITQLENAKTQSTEQRLIRAQFEHAIAVLIGKAPADFSLQATTQKIEIPTIVPTLPSTLLQRRPDIAAAEERVMAANADIGVARAAFFPDVNLMATGGVESASLRNLLSMPSLFWSLGPAITQTIFDGGKIQGQLAQAKASYHETVANYRQTVLNAFQEVEDSLASQRYLQDEIVSQTKALHAADSALKQSIYLYEGGLTTYLDVVVSQNIALQALIASIDIQTRQQIANVTLIKALGGGWL